MYQRMIEYVVPLLLLDIAVSNAQNFSHFAVAQKLGHDRLAPASVRSPSFTFHLALSM